MSHSIFLFCGPRGAGKGTLVGALLTSFPQFSKIVCHTTRPMRPGEREGDQYRFVTRASFDLGRRAGEFVGWKEISPIQISGLSYAELTRHEYGVTDVTPDIALVARRAIMQKGGRVGIIGVRAPVQMRQERIRLREPALSDEIIDRMLREDPVGDIDVERVADVVIDNDVDGDIESAADIMRQFVCSHLEGGR